MTAYPTYANPFITNGAAWFWNEGEHKLNQARLVGNVLGVPNWTSLTELSGVTQRATAFRIDGEVTCGAPWLSLAPATGSLVGGTTASVTATFDASNIANNTTLRSVACFANNDVSQPLVMVPVKMLVRDANICPVQLVEDPGFESTSSTYTNAFWSSTSTNSSSHTSICDSRCGNNLHDGLYWLWFGGYSGNATQEDGTASQSVVMPTGGSRWINFQLRRTQASAAANSTLTLEIDGTVPRGGADQA